MKHTWTITNTFIITNCLKSHTPNPAPGTRCLPTPCQVFTCITQHILHCIKNEKHTNYYKHIYYEEQATIPWQPESCGQHLLEHFASTFLPAPPQHFASTSSALCQHLSEIPGQIISLSLICIMIIHTYYTHYIQRNANFSVYWAHPAILACSNHARPLPASLPLSAFMPMQLPSSMPLPVSM